MGRSKGVERPGLMPTMPVQNSDDGFNIIDVGANAKNLQEMLDAERKRNAELKDAYANLQSSLDKSLLQNSQGNINISKLVDEINASNRFIKQLVEAKDKSDSLNMVLTTYARVLLSTGARM